MGYIFFWKRNDNGQMDYVRASLESTIKDMQESYEAWGLTVSKCYKLEEVQ